jgi:acetyl-CoA C-acetyltransferase
MRDVYLIAAAQLPVEQASTLTLRQMGALVARQTLAAAGIERVDAVYVGNMLSDDLQGQKHVAALIADEASLTPTEALEVRAATASGAASLRMGQLAVASGAADLVLALGVEKMSEGVATPALAKALDAQFEVPDGDTLIRRNAELMDLYLDRYQVPDEALAHFSVNAHRNAAGNPHALFRTKQITVDQVLTSRLIQPPIRLFDCSPICDGAAAVLLASEKAPGPAKHAVKVLASSVATDRFRVRDRRDPLQLAAAARSAQLAFDQAGLQPSDIDLVEVHDAFSIMACLLLEAAGFAERGSGWRLAMEGEIGLTGRIPITTMGGLKARGHPIGATGLYQAAEIFLQLTGQAGPNQVAGAKVAMMQSVGGAATTLITHLFGV